MNTTFKTFAAIPVGATFTFEDWNGNDFTMRKTGEATTVEIDNHHGGNGNETDKYNFVGNEFQFANVDEDDVCPPLPHTVEDGTVYTVPMTKLEQAYAGIPREAIATDGKAGGSCLWHRAHEYYLAVIVPLLPRCPICKGVGDPRGATHEVCRIRKERGIAIQQINTVNKCQCSPCSPRR